ncbi:MAG: MmcQ/YjbR family DNA-binding protein [Odoribacter sp.]|nr:MmcQ/YjbR family DNA-binding protein [Odoribacter sp.]
MNIEELTGFCQTFPHVTTEILWDNVLVFKVGGKMFCFAPLDEDLRMNLKCDPEEALELRERFPAVLPGYHMNKKYWNTVIIDGSISDSMLKVWIGNSYRLVLAGLSPKKASTLGL